MEVCSSSSVVHVGPQSLVHSQAVALPRYVTATLPSSPASVLTPCSYLKTRILPVLESMQLIKKEWQQPSESSVLSHLKHKQCMWRLSPEGNNAANTAKYWDKLTSPDLTENDLARMGFAAKPQPAWVLAQLREKQGLRSKEEKIADKDARRDKKGKLSGEERQRDLTRTHLNTRRRNGREVKEQRYAEEMSLRREAKAAAEEAVKAEMAQ